MNQISDANVKVTRTQTLNFSLNFQIRHIPSNIISFRREFHYYTDKKISFIYSSMHKELE
jgi:hypothetical protein